MYAARAYAMSFEPQAMGVDLEFWLSAGLSIGLAVVGGYMRALGKRISMIEFDNRQLQSQISAVREMVKGDYPDKREVQDQFGELKEMIGALGKRMDSRMDYFSSVQQGRNYPPEGR